MSTKTVYHKGQELPVGKVYSTQDYGRFKIDHRNRPISQKHLETLYDSVVRKNLLAEYPILVDKSMVVIDGQHRLEVSKSLNVPIHYIISEMASMDDIVHTTDAVKKWNNHDQLHRWKSEGKDEYEKLSDFYEKHKVYKGKTFLTLGQCISLCHYGDRVTMNRAFKIGDYTCNDLIFAEKVIAALMDFSEYIDFFSDKIFISTVTSLVSNRHYDHVRMMMKMKYLSTRLRRCATVDDYMPVITDIYNYKTSIKDRVTLRKLSSGDNDSRTDRKFGQSKS